MEGVLQQCACGELKDESQFIGKQGQRVKSCQSCRDKQASYRAAAASKPVPADKKYCSSCGKTRNRSDFHGKAGQDCAICKPCRDKSLARKEARKKEAAADPVPEGHKVCLNCSHTRLLAEFVGTRDPNCDLCSHCRGIIQASEKRAREKDPEKVRERWRRHEKKRQALDPLGYRREYYKDNAKKKNRVMLLTDDQLDALFQMPCHYCGAAPLNGIDRVDNNLGYMTTNCVPCCTPCNLSKWNWELDQFLTQCQSIASYQGTGLFSGRWPFEGVQHVKLSKYKIGARSRDLEFALTPKDFRSITAGSCHYCGKKNDKTHKNGVDRKDSARGYLVENCVTCCWPCNKLKKEEDYENFIARCQRIAARMETLELNRESY